MHVPTRNFRGPCNKQETWPWPPACRSGPKRMEEGARLCKHNCSYEQKKAEQVCSGASLSNLGAQKSLLDNVESLSDHRTGQIHTRRSLRTEEATEAAVENQDLHLDHGKCPSKPKNEELFDR